MYRKKINDVLCINSFYARVHFCRRLTTSANSLASDQARMEFLDIFGGALCVKSGTCSWVKVQNFQNPEF